MILFRKFGPKPLALVLSFTISSSAIYPGTSGAESIDPTTLDAAAEKDGDTQEIPEFLQAEGLPDSIKAFQSYSTELDVEEEAGKAALKTAEGMTPNQFEALKIDQKLGLISSIILMGHGGRLKRLINEIMNRLSVQGDNPNYTVKFSPSPMPNAAIFQGKALMLINAGLIAYSKNVDELAYVIAHEMTHDNRAFMKALDDRKDIDEILNQVTGYSDLEPEQREEIRADLGAIERTIKAGYNPWAGYDFNRKFSKFASRSPDMKIMKLVFKIFGKRSFDYVEAHPASEIRMAAIKAFIVAKSQKVDIADNVKEYHRYPLSLNILRYRLGLATWPLMNIWVHRGIYGYMGYNMLDHLLSAIFGTTTSDPSIFSQAASGVGSGLGAATHTIGAIFSSAFTPIKELFASMPWMMDFMSQVGGAVDQGLTWALVGAFASLPFIAMGMMIATLYSADPQLKNMALLTQTWKETLPLLKNVVDPNNPSNTSNIISIVSKMTEMSKLIETINQNGLFVRWASDLNKLTWIRLRLSWVFSSQLDLLADGIQKGSAHITNEDFSRLSKALDGLGGYILESPIVLDSLFLVYKSYNGHELDKGSSVQRLDGESNWVYALRLNMWLKEKSNLDIATKVELAYQLHRLGLKDSAYKLMGLLPISLANFVFSSENADRRLTSKLIYLFNHLKSGERSLGRSPYFQKKLQEAWVNEQRLIQIANSLGDKLVSQSFTQSVPYPGWRWVTLRNYIDKADWASAASQLDSQFSRIDELALFSDKELVERNANLGMISNELVDAISRNQNWITSEHDIDTLLSKDYFWPVLAGSAVNFTDLEKLFAPSMTAMMKDYSNIWKYEPSAAEKNHTAILNGLKRLGKYPTSFGSKLTLWKRLTDRGVTTTTDSLFQELYDQANVSQRVELEKAAVGEGRIWEPELKTMIARNRLALFGDYELLMKRVPSPERTELLKKVISFLEQTLPERGRGFMEILEKISVDISSSREESLLIQAAKSGGAGGERQEDLGLRVLSDVLNTILKWRKKHQWAFVQYLRGDIEATAKIRNAFKTIGPERVRRMFQLMPTMAKTVAMDAFMDAPSGLLGRMRIGGGWSKVIVDHIMQGKTEDETMIARELLTGFLYALKKTGNKALRSYVLSYLLSLPKSSSDSSGETLKNVLELFGTTGVKIGQFLVASSILPERETAILRSLQEQAKVPEREEVYKDLEGIFGTTDLPFDLKNLLGAASLKYAMLAQEKSTGQDIVLKVLRLESVAHTRLEFMILSKMSDYLVQKNGRKYGVFNSIVNASRQAVERELVAKQEVNKGRLADKYVYVKASDASIKVSVPKELLVKDRMIVSEYAEGISFFRLMPEIQPLIAEKILKMEGDVLFSNQSEILFDPDRHAGNYRIHIRQYSGEQYIVLESAQISPIDFGQLIRKFSPADRDFVEYLFAISQIGAKAGAIDWMVEKINGKLNMTDSQRGKLAKSLRLYFPSVDLKPVTAYFSILSAIELSGFTLDIKYYDFVRAIIQLKQYEPFINKNRNWLTPSELFENSVMLKVESLKTEVELSWRDRLTFAWNNPRQALGYIKDFMGIRKQNFLPMPTVEIDDEDSQTAQTNYEEVSDEVIAPVVTIPQNARSDQTAENVDCSALLTAKSLAHDLKAAGGQ